MTGDVYAHACMHDNITHARVHDTLPPLLCKPTHPPTHPPARSPAHPPAHADLQAIGLGATCALSLFGGAIASVAGPNLRAVMLNVNEPETRGVALALQVGGCHVMS